MSSDFFDGLGVPLIYSQELTVELIGSESRTATGEMRANVDATKRQWLLQTRPMTVADRDTLINYLESFFYGPVAFTLDEFFPIEVPSYVTVDESRSYILPNRRSLNITVDEV
jgi:hypothetical protein